MQSPSREELAVANLVKKFLAFFFRIRRFTKPHYWVLSCTTWIQSTSKYPTSLRSILILSFQDAYLFQILQLKFCTHFLFSDACYMSQPLWFGKSNIWWRFYHAGFSTFCFVFPRWSRYSPHYSSQTTSICALPHVGVSSYRPVHNNRWNESLYILIFKFLDRRREDKRCTCMIKWRTNFSFNKAVWTAPSFVSRPVTWTVTLWW